MGPARHRLSGSRVGRGFGRKAVAGVLAALALAGVARAQSAACAGPPLPGLKLSFDESFDRLRLYDGRPGSGWRPEYGFGGPGTLGSRSLPDEQQVYVDPAFKGAGERALGLDPFAVRGGVLSIRASPTPPALSAALWGRPYVSGLLTTKFLFSQTYGYFEGRLRLPAGKGLLPQFWLIPVETVWPPEIDVMESLGDPAVAYMTVHSKAAGPHTSSLTAVRILKDPTGFHRFGVLWSSRELVWYVDGFEVKRSPTPVDMTRPMHLLVNLAIGTPWSGRPPADFRSAALDIDYIRAWALADPAATVPRADCPRSVQVLERPPAAPGRR